MRLRRLLIALVVALAFVVTPSLSATGQKKTVHVKTYTKKDGTNGRPGYVIDHIVSLACGGKDAPSNMQWQTIADGQAKDKTERVGCR